MRKNARLPCRFSAAKFEADGDGRGDGGRDRRGYFGCQLRLSRAEGRQKRRRFGLLKDLPNLEEILKEIKKSISIPLTLKIRSGFSDSNINCVEVAKMAEQCGVEHIQLHGRTREQGYKGLANWDLVKAVKEAV